LIFAASLVGFAARRTDGYTHGHKAVSELGAVGAADALAFNLLGFVAPGVLVACLAFAIFKRAPAGTSRTGTALVALSGLSMVAAGVFPVDMEARDSATSTLHLAAASLSGLFWCLSLFWLAPVLRGIPSRSLRRHETYAVTWTLLAPKARGGDVTVSVPISRGK
jgi:hypothetical membrane protein